MTETNYSQDYALIRRLAEPGRLQDSMLDLWKRTRIDWSFVTGDLTATVRGSTSLGSDERRMLLESLYGMIRHLRRIDSALAAGGLVVATTAPCDRERLLAYLVVERGLSPDEAAALRPGVDWHAVADIDARLAREGNAVRRIGRACSLPDWLTRALVADFGEQAAGLAASLNERALTTIRTNTLCTSRQDLAAWLAEAGVETRAGRYAPTALHIEAPVNLFGLPAFKRGAFELQDEGSQLLAALVAPPPRALVVDYCAGAGGKTLALAAALGNRGRIVATDTDVRKLRELRRRTRRAGATNVQSLPLQPDGTWPAALARLEGTAGRVLVDAPCTGIGSLRRHPEMRWRLTPADLERYPARQLEICEQALRLLAPGGHLIYGTCTLLRAENQGVVERLLAAHADVELVPAATVLSDVLGADAAHGEGIVEQVTDETGAYLLVTPDRHGTDGFFAAVLRRKA